METSSWGTRLNPLISKREDINGVKLQVWATWLFYAIFLDLGDAVES
ncbi:MAG: hypothetical protein HWQ38_06635 [Nostoc sp. NMS7]|nr:hypothetical protein [Nostoc sp. NMS7]MBN3946169.1 hypothetical protein [Nostoc sp. NMS7]